MSKSCEYYENLIFSLPDAGLTDSEAEELRAHLRVCPECRHLFAAFADVTETLKEDNAAPPSSLADGVMARVWAYEEAKSAGSVSPETRRPIRSRRTKKNARRWIPVAAAACLAAVIGGAAAVTGIFGTKGASSAAAESIAMEAPAALSEEYPAVDGYAMNPAPAPAAAADFDRTEAEQDDGEEFIAADIAGMDMAASRAVYTWENPAQVPEGREADFEALIRSADRGAAGIPAADWEVFTAVEYHGVIYEFLTDSQGEFLLWQDAAESAYPVLSPGTVERLLDIIG